jgi:23S rRNA (pseudouridine1915-N3)-methyltransferase
MKIRILWVGKTKERHLAEGIEKYLGRIRPFADIEAVEIKEMKGEPVESAIRKEGGRILKKTDQYVLLDEMGRGIDSLGFAEYLSKRSHVDFVLGGAFGVSAEVRNGASDTLSLSRMTLTHEMARLLLLEQIYRAMMINSKRGYHH